ncbi:MAG: response regulator transcription factor [Candidatus Peregrinibacteria bacterium]|nr:response regulator transcription factor [Candidatus Peregrinibacteria bacterium]MDZ4244794.1 response regulator transcription factor [Candidatus Gracilibacteria bacterium]
MKLLFIANEYAEADIFKKSLKRHDIEATFITYNQFLSEYALIEFEFTSAVLIVDSSLEIKQFLLLLHQKKLHIPKILLWKATRTVPKSLQDRCEHHLTESKDVFETVRKIKEIVYSYTVNDLYNEANSEVLQFGDIILDRRYRQMQIGGTTISLRNKEFALLEFFMLHPQRLLCRNTILESVWDINKTFMTNTIDVHIGKLRRILGKKNDLIKTVHSIGYIFG